MASFTVNAVWAAVVVDVDAVKSLARHQLVSNGLWTMRNLRTVLLNMDVVFVGGGSIALTSSVCLMVNGISFPSCLLPLPLSSDSLRGALCLIDLKQNVLLWCMHLECSGFSFL